MYSNNLILLSHRKENLIKESNRKNQQKKKNHHTKLHKVTQNLPNQTRHQRRSFYRKRKGSKGIKKRLEKKLVPSKFLLEQFSS